jgi:hypothetical protein
MHARAGAALQVRKASEADERFVVRLAEQAFGEFDPNASRTTANLLREAGAEAQLLEGSAGARDPQAALGGVS